jgi:2-dehydropantoate 2-reductase
MIKTVSIIGIGAVGAIYALRLTELLGKKQVRVIVDPPRMTRYHRDGLYLNGEAVDFNLVTPDEPMEAADLLILATKNHQLHEATRMIAGHIGEHTAILSLLNGIDSETQLAEHYGQQRVLYGFTTAIDSTREGNRIIFTNQGIIYFGEKDNTITSRLQAIEALFKAANIQNRIPDDIHRELWAKFMVNVSINTISAITHATYGECAHIPAIKQMIISTQREVITLAQAQGIRGLDESYIERYQKIFASLEPSGKTSMLQDRESGRLTENPWFCKRASALGKELGVPTPLCDMLGNLLEAVEIIQQTR